MSERCPERGRLVPVVSCGEYECLDEHDNADAEMCRGGGFAAGRAEVISEPRRKFASVIRVSEHQARQTTGPRAQLTGVADRMLTEMVAHDQIEGTLSGAYEVRIEVVPVERWWSDA